MEQYRTEEEQVEALRRWWDENGRSIIVAIIIALAGSFGWQAWRDYDQGQQDYASDIYQAILDLGGDGELSAEQRVTAGSYADQLKADYANTTYAQFAALQLARGAVNAGELDKAEAELRWVLGKAGKGSDIAQVTELRLARVVAAQGNAEQALDILAQADEGGYGAAYAVARGDILLSLGRDDEAKTAYASAQVMGAGNNAAQASGAGTLQYKLQSLNPIPAGALENVEPAAVEAAATVPEQSAEIAGDDLTAAPTEGEK